MRIAPGHPASLTPPPQANPEVKHINHSFRAFYVGKSGLKGALGAKVILDVSLSQRVLIALMLRLIMNDGFSFDLSIACSEFFRVSWVNRC